MYVLNKTVGFLCDPLTVAALGAMLSLVFFRTGRRRLATRLAVLCVGWTWFWATPLAIRLVGVPLERPYLVGGRVPDLGDFPSAEAIVLHGGAMVDDSEIGGRGDMRIGADRVWMAARLWKAGKAPVVYVIGTEAARTTTGLLEDFGVPTNAMVFAEEARNTEEETLFVAGAAARAVGGERRQGRKARVLVVTSAWHMRRTMMMYARYAPEIEAIPAASDFENTVRTANERWWFALKPQDEALVMNRISLHEWIGIIGYALRWRILG